MCVKSHVGYISSPMDEFNCGELGIMSADRVEEEIPETLQETFERKYQKMVKAVLEYDVHNPEWKTEGYTVEEAKQKCEIKNAFCYSNMMSFKAFLHEVKAELMEANAEKVEDAEVLITKFFEDTKAPPEFMREYVAGIQKQRGFYNFRRKKRAAGTWQKPKDFKKAEAEMAAVAIGSDKRKVVRQYGASAEGASDTRAKQRPSAAPAEGQASDTRAKQRPSAAPAEGRASAKRAEQRPSAAPAEGRASATRAEQRPSIASEEEQMYASQGQIAATGVPKRASSASAEQQRYASAEQQRYASAEQQRYARGY